MAGTEIKLTDKDTLPTRWHIRRVSERLNTLYRDVAAERRRLHAEEWERNESFSILGEIESWTTDVQGYAAWVAKPGRHPRPLEAIADLEGKRLDALPHVAEWFASPANTYLGLKNYVETVDYLRLLVMEYLENVQLSNHADEPPSTSVSPTNGVSHALDSRTHS
jgi:hypothetical protein